MSDLNLRSNQAKLPYATNLSTISACILTQHLHYTLLTGGTVVNQSSQGFAVPPVTVEVVDGQLGHFVLYPAQQALFGGHLLSLLVILVIPHGHRDGIVQDESPDKAQDQL